MLSVWKVWGSISGSVESDTVSPTTYHRCDESLVLCYPGAKPQKWPLSRRNEMGSAELHAPV